MRSSLYLFLSLFILFSFTGCVTIIDAVSDEPVQPDPSKRSFGAYIDDKQLRAIVTVNIRKANPQLNDLDFEVYSYNSVILITGQAPSNELREIVGEVARNTNRVRQVYNELEVSPKLTFGSRTKDGWMSTKIKSKLMLYRDIDSSRVEVFVNNGTVYLMGLLSRAQTEKITDVVRKQKGVRKVVRAIEYID